MFWQSVIQGLSSLTNWEIWVGMLAVGLIQVTFVSLLGAMVMNDKPGVRSMVGFLLGLSLSPVIQALAVTAFIVLLLPSLFLGRGFTPLELVDALAGTSIKYGLLALALVFVLCFIPIVGGLMSKMPGLPTFLQGILVFRPISKILLYSVLGKDKVSNDFYPGFWACVGYLIIGHILIYVAFIVISIVEDKIKERRDPIGHMLDRHSEEPTTFQFIALQFLSPMLGIIPLLMYAKYVALSVQASVGR